MKKIILLFCFTLFASSSFSQLYIDENFDYTAGDSIGAHGWLWNTGGTNTIFVTSPGLTYPGYANSGIGNATTLKPTGNDAYKELSGKDSVGSFYASFMVRVDSAKAQGDYFLALLQAGSTSFYEGRVQAAFRDGGLAFGITKGNTTTDTAIAGGVWTPGIYSFGTTYVVVLKYTFVPGGTNNDQVSLFVFSSGVPDTEPTPTLGPNVYPSQDASSIGRIALRQGTATRAPYSIVDGIRVTKYWMPSVWTVKVAMQGLYDPSMGVLSKRDTVDIFLQSTSNPGVNVDSCSAVIDSVSMTGKYAFGNAADGQYYLLVKYRHSPEFRNGLNTWSKAGGQALTSANGSYDFTSSSSQAFGNNMILEGSVYTIYSGDLSQEGTIDLTDLIEVNNDAKVFVTGYVKTDVNGDDRVDLADILIVYGNTVNFVAQVAP